MYYKFLTEELKGPWSYDSYAKYVHSKKWMPVKPNNSRPIMPGAGIEDSGSFEDVCTKLCNLFAKNVIGASSL